MPKLAQNVKAFKIFMYLREIWDGVSKRAERLAYTLKTGAHFNATATPNNSKINNK